MSSSRNCQHINQVTDEHEGSVVCIDCGLVMFDQIFCYDIQLQKTEKEIEDKQKNYKEILSRLNMSDDFLFDLKIQKKEKISSIASNLYININRTSSISLKEISSVTGVCEKQLNQKTKGNITILDKEKMLDKYCAQLNISFKNYTVIKEILSKIKISGHNPLTVVASCIYIFCKKNKLKLSMRNISQAVGISCISIQRFLKKNKNELSCWC